MKHLTKPPKTFPSVLMGYEKECSKTTGFKKATSQPKQFKERAPRIEHQHFIKGKGAK